MSISRVVPKSFVLGLVLAGLVAQTSRASAEEEFDVSVSAGKVVVTTKGKWHINKEYPWRLVIGEKKLDKSKFVLSEASATILAPKGPAKVRGGVCNGDQCMRLEKAVDVP